MQEEKQALITFFLWKIFICSTWQLKFLYNKHATPHTVRCSHSGITNNSNLLGRHTMLTNKQLPTIWRNCAFTFRMCLDLLTLLWTIIIIYHMPQGNMAENWNLHAALHGFLGYWHCVVMVVNNDVSNELAASIFKDNMCWIRCDQFISNSTL